MCVQENDTVNYNILSFINPKIGEQTGNFYIFLFPMAVSKYSANSLYIIEIERNTYMLHNCCNCDDLFEIWFYSQTHSMSRENTYHNYFLWYSIQKHNVDNRYEQKPGM